MNAKLPAPSAEERAHSARLSELLRQEIGQHGAMPFSRFMERCLYAPGLGYYSAGKHKFGAAGDFVTAPELGTLFARAVAALMAPLLVALDGDAEVIELGGGSGAFAAAALPALAAARALPRRYCILEPSADLRQRQQRRLAATLPPALAARVVWIERPPQQDWRGVLFANEVIDALPATRFLVRQGEIFEEHIGLGEDGGFSLQQRPADALVSSAVRHVQRSLDAPFAEGYRSELLPQLPYWMQAVLGAQQAGLALFVDYGYPRREYYQAARRDGTLRAFYRHRVHDDVLAWPGLQDLTASVDFTALAEAARHAGFDLAAYLPQAQFLLAAGLGQIFEQAYAEAADETARYALAQQVKQLTLPGAMGEPFQAMLLSRGLDADALPAALRAASRGDRL